MSLQLMLMKSIKLILRGGVDDGMDDYEIEGEDSDADFTADLDQAELFEEFFDGGEHI